MWLMITFPSLAISSTGQNMPLDASLMPVPPHQKVALPELAFLWKPNQRDHIRAKAIKVVW
jgi:hypothetical protein